MKEDGEEKRRWCRGDGRRECGEVRDEEGKRRRWKVKG